MDDKEHKPVRVGEAAARILERLKQSAGQLANTEVTRYDCEECKDTGLVKGKHGAKRCQHVKQAAQEQDKGKFF